MSDKHSTELNTLPFTTSHCYWQLKEYFRCKKKTMKNMFSTYFLIELAFYSLFNYVIKHRLMLYQLC